MEKQLQQWLASNESYLFSTLGKQSAYTLLNVLLSHDCLCILDDIEELINSFVDSSDYFRSINAPVNATITQEIADTLNNCWLYLIEMKRR